MNLNDTKKLTRVLELLVEHYKMPFTTTHDPMSSEIRIQCHSPTGLLLGETSVRFEEGYDDMYFGLFTGMFLTTDSSDLLKVLRKQLKSGV